jgi:hypothetical protein
MEETVSHRVIDTIAAREGVSTSELTYPLFEAINPEALDMLFRDTTGELTFEYHGYQVRVDHEGNVEAFPSGQSE